VDAVMTSSDHPSGTDRLAEASRLLGLADKDVVVNVQGDEPLIAPSLIDQVAALLDGRDDAVMGTAAHPIAEVPEFTNPNVVKVVTDASGLALTFSRAPVPWWRDAFGHGIHALPEPAPLRHIGIYSYRCGFLRRFPALPQAPLERIEALEQMRALWHGYRIAVHVAHNAPAPGVDTPEDLERVRRLFSSDNA
jgi:3-deoxy-manno-octulosonate cytidylyltransferase (CMP-KDO synthetase)